MTDQIKLLGVRLSFPHLFKPKSVEEGAEAKFSAGLILDKVQHAEQIKQVSMMIISMAKEKFGGTEEVRKLREKGKLVFCLHEGTEKDDYEGYDDSNMFINAASKVRPMILDRNRGQLAEADGRPYGGCFVDAIIRLWVQDNKYGKKVNAELRGVQFVKDGEAFGAAPLDPDEFTDYSEGEPAGEPEGKKSGAEQEAEKATGSKAKTAKESKPAADDEIKF